MLQIQMVFFENFCFSSNLSIILHTQFFFGLFAPRKKTNNCLRNKWFRRAKDLFRFVNKNVSKKKRVNVFDMTYCYVMSCRMCTLLSVWVGFCCAKRIWWMVIGKCVVISLEAWCIVKNGRRERESVQYMWKISQSMSDHYNREFNALPSELTVNCTKWV